MPNVPGTSKLTNNESDSSEDSRNNEPSTTSYSFSNSEYISKISSTNVNFCSSSSGNSSKQLFSTHQLSKPENDSDDDTSCEVVNVTNEVIYVSSDNEEPDYNHIYAKKYSESHYCSICKMKNTYNHNCFQYNNEFSTCLVPNCNILAKSVKDITPHIKQHMGMPPGAILCHQCFQENKLSERDINGYHTTCRINNLFKCYACNMIFHNMGEFATHKLKQHKGQLKDYNGNYLCLYCEISSSDMMMIIEHQKYCREFQNKKDQENYENECDRNNYIEPSRETTLLSDNINITKQVNKRAKGIRLPCSSKYMLFTCLKPSCNLIFINFSVFKCHHREHFGLGNELMCWQCCSPFTNLNFLRMHQVKGGCRTPGMFKCYECSIDFDNLQSLSIHKYTIHDGKLLMSKKSKKIIMCVFCDNEINISDFKIHLINCKANVKNIVYKNPQRRKKFGHKCSVCEKNCLTAAALTSHEKIHIPSTGKVANKRMNNTSIKSQNDQLVGVLDNTKINDEINQPTSSTYQSNDTSMSVGTDEDGFYYCTKCPKKFNSKKGLSAHFKFCFKPKLKLNLPRNYYCSECEEYYTRINFGHHWKTVHGIKLPYNKKRFSCNKCNYKFVYKVALTMHIEHVHCEVKNSATNNETLNSNVIMYPIVSETLLITDEDNYNGQYEENANNCGIQGNNDEQENKINCNTYQIDNDKEVEISNDDNTEKVKNNAQSITQIKNCEMEIEKTIINQDLIEVDSTNEMENNDEDIDYENCADEEIITINDDENNTSDEVDSFHCSDEMVDINATQNNTNEKEIIHPAFTSKEN